jgi:hypothetical protein
MVFIKVSREIKVLTARRRPRVKHLRIVNCWICISEAMAIISDAVVEGTKMPK